MVEDAAIVSRARQILEAARPAADRMCSTITRDKYYEHCGYNRAFESGGAEIVQPSPRCTFLRGYHERHLASKARSTHSCGSVCKVNLRRLHPASALDIDVADALPLLALAEAIGATAVVDDCLTMIAAAKDAVIDACRSSFSDGTIGKEIDWAVAVGHLARWPRQDNQTLSPRRSSVSPPANAPRSTRENAADLGRDRLPLSRSEEVYHHCNKDVTRGIQQATGNESREDGALDLSGRRNEANDSDMLPSERIDRALASPTNSVRSNDSGTGREESRMTCVCLTTQPFLNGSTPHSGDEVGKAMKLATRKTTLDHKCQTKTMGRKGKHSQVLMRESPPPPPSLTSPVPCPLDNDVAQNDSMTVVESGEGKSGKLRVRTGQWKEPDPTKTSADVSKGRERKLCAQRCTWATKPTFLGVSQSCTDAGSCCEVETAVADGRQVSVTDEGRDNRRKKKCPHHSPSYSSGVRGGVQGRALASMPIAGDEGDDYNRMHHRCLAVSAEALFKEEKRVLSTPDGEVRGSISKPSTDRVTSPGTTSTARPCDDGQTAIDVMVGNIPRVSSKSWEPDVTAMLIARENQRHCEQARKRALQRLRKARLQQGVKRAEATAENRELCMERRLGRKKKFATMLDGPRRREGGKVKNSGAIDGGSWCEAAQAFANQKSVGEDT